MIPIKQPSQVMSGPGFSIKNKTKQAGFAVPHSSLTIGLVGLGLGWVWVGYPKRIWVSKISRRSGGGWVVNAIIQK